MTATLKTGPRGGKRVSGRCLCDEPELKTVRDVRKFGKQLGECSYCGDHGLNLIPFGTGRYHVRCLIRAYDFGTLLAIEEARARVRMCCLSKRQMKRLLEVT